MKKTWIQDPETRKLIPKEEYIRAQRQPSYVQGDIEPFVSPIDGKAIYSRRQLREHNHKHGVTDLRDYGPDWFSRKAKERSDNITGKTDRAGRIDAIKRSLYQHGVID